MVETVYTIPVGAHGNDFPLVIGLSWTGYLTPYLEMNTVWSYLSVGSTGPNEAVMNSAPPVLFCRSSGKRAGDRDISYVVIVVAAYADRSVRVLNENMSKETFVRLCQTNSGVIVNSNDLN